MIILTYYKLEEDEEENIVGEECNRAIVKILGVSEKTDSKQSTIVGLLTLESKKYANIYKIQTQKQAKIYILIHRIYIQANAVIN